MLNILLLLIIFCQLYQVDDIKMVQLKFLSVSLRCFGLEVAARLLVSKIDGFQNRRKAPASPAPISDMSSVNQ